MLFQVGKSLVSIGEGAMLRGGNTRLGHQFFGKGFAAFQRRACCARPKDMQAALAKNIGDTLDKRNLRPDDRQINVATLGKIASSAIWVAPSGMHSAHAAMPGLPGAAYTW